tara:strand:+ start:2218 stop:2439 length:222 start_codon:yes stop_codon:yes gene_type:complete
MSSEVKKENIVKYKERKENYYKCNKEKLIEYQRLYYKKNAEKIKKYQKEYLRKKKYKQSLENIERKKKFYVTF